MTCFLTSSTLTEAGELNNQNGFVDRLRDELRSPCRALFITASPDDPARTARYAALTRASMEGAGIAFAEFSVLDRTASSDAAALVARAELIVLSGGHVPTQNQFFREIGLRELLGSFNGVLLGVSAGSMNAAETVYAHVELPGEVVDPDYRRFLPGLGLTRTMLLPHFQAIRHDVLDGLRVIEDVALPDSMGRCFYALTDGSYLLVRGGTETLYGEAYRIRDGELEQICRTDESYWIR